MKKKTPIVFTVNTKDIQMINWRRKRRIFKHNKVWNKIL